MAGFGNLPGNRCYADRSAANSNFVRPRRQPARKAASELGDIGAVTILARTLIGRQEAEREVRLAHLGDDLVIGAVGKPDAAGGAADRSHHPGEVAIKVAKAYRIVIDARLKILPGTG